MQLFEDGFNLFGELPGSILKLLREALEAVPDSIFFDEQGNPLRREVRLDREVARYLADHGHSVETNYRPFSQCEFNVDIYVAQQKLIVEIEKGKAPRLDLDVLKISAACAEDSSKHRYGLLVIPTTYVRPAQYGPQTPYQYLLRLRRLIAPLASHLPAAGISVIGYVDPRGE